MFKLCRGLLAIICWSEIVFLTKKSVLMFSGGISEMRCRTSPVPHLEGFTRFYFIFMIEFLYIRRILALER